MTTPDKMNEINLQEIMKDQSKEKFLIEFADFLFKDNGKSRNIRIVYLPTTEEEKKKDYYDTVLLIIENRLALWFFMKNGNWEYDGWEMGDYTDKWTSKNLSHNQIRE